MIIVSFFKFWNHLKLSEYLAESVTHFAARELPPGLRIRIRPSAMPKRKQGAVEAVAAAESIDPVMRAKQRMKELAMKIGLEGRDLKPYVSWRGSIWRFSEFVSRKLMHSSHIKRLDIEMRWFSPFLLGLLRGIAVFFFLQYSLIRQLGWLWHVATKVNRIDSAITEAWQKNRDAKLRGQVSDEWMSG